MGFAALYPSYKLGLAEPHPEEPRQRRLEG